MIHRTLVVDPNNKCCIRFLATNHNLLTHIFNCILYVYSVDTDTLTACSSIIHVYTVYFMIYIAFELMNDVFISRATDFVFMAGYGMSQPVGHLDFYPNNGKEQPGCDLTEGPLVPLTLVKQGLEEASRVLVACNHVRAIKLFTESINGKCPYVGKLFILRLLHYNIYSS